MKKSTILTIIALTLITLSLALVAQIAPPAGVAVSEKTADHLLASYERALLFDKQATDAAAQRDAAIADYNRAVADAIASEKLPEGTTFTVDIAKKDVKAQLPAKKSDAKPAKSESK
jgi:hypothetical protein